MPLIFKRTRSSANPKSTFNLIARLGFGARVVTGSQALKKLYGGSPKLFVLRGELAGTRTQDPRLKRALLYQLSYELEIRPLPTNYHRASHSLTTDHRRTDMTRWFDSPTIQFCAAQEIQANKSSSRRSAFRGNSISRYDGTRMSKPNDYQLGINPASRRK